MNTSAALVDEKHLHADLPFNQKTGKLKLGLPKKQSNVEKDEKGNRKLIITDILTVCFIFSEIYS